MAEIAGRLEKAGSDLLADDPKRLRRLIADLERKLREKAAAGVDEAEITRRVSAAVATIHDGYARHTSEAGAALMEISRDLGTLAGRLDAVRGVLVSEGPPAPTKPPKGASSGPSSFSRGPSSPSPAPEDASNGQEAPSSHSQPGTDRAPAGSLTRRKSPSNNEPTGLSGPQQRVIDALAWLSSLGFGERASRIQVAFLARYKPKGGSFNNTLGSLRTGGLIEYPSSGEVKLTGEGHRLARHPDVPLTDEALHKAVMERLDGPQRRVLQPLIDRYPLDMTVEELADDAGYEAGGGSFNNTRGSLRSLGLVDYPSPGRVVALPVLFASGGR